VVGIAITALEKLPNSFPSLQSMKISFVKEHAAHSGQAASLLARQKGIAMALCGVNTYKPRDLANLHHVGIMNIGGSLLGYGIIDDMLSILPSFALTSTRGPTGTAVLPLSRILQNVLQKLSPQMLTELYLGTTNASHAEPKLPGDVHFPKLINLKVEGFRIDSVVHQPAKETNFSGFIAKHKPSLLRLILVNCSFVTTDDARLLDPEKRMHTWLEEVGLTKVAEYS